MSSAARKEQERFSAQIEHALSQISRNFGTEINTAFETAPTAERVNDVRDMKANPEKAARKKMKTIEKNRKTIFRDMKILQSVRKGGWGIKKVLGKFFGFRKLGKDDYLEEEEESDDESDSDDDSTSEEGEAEVLEEKQAAVEVVEKMAFVSTAAPQPQIDPAQMIQQMVQQSAEFQPTTGPAYPVCNVQICSDEDSEDFESDQSDSDEELEDGGECSGGDDDDSCSEGYSTDDYSSCDDDFYDDLVAEMENEMGVVIPDGVRQTEVATTAA